MANAVFDGLADIFTDVLGEPVTYTPSGGAPRSIQAIWTEVADEFALGDHAASDISRTTLSVRAEDLTPTEDDVATRDADGKTMKVTTPILPDGKGMIRCNLADIS